MEQGDISEASEFKLSDQAFARVKARVHQLAGISLSEAKRSLVISRLGKLVRRGRLGSIDAFLDLLDRSEDPALVQDFVNALTTNLTRFYREAHHFEHLRAHVGGLMKAPPRLSADGRPRLRIWSAGCSTGQEPYTIALDLLDAYPELRRWDFRILATDIDTQVLERAASGRYGAAEIADLDARQVALFDRAGPDEVSIPAEARRLIAFKPLNLMAEWPMRGPFDAVFCRNVVIYFDRATQGVLFRRIRDVLAPGGMLYIGHSENLGAGAEGFRLIGKTSYQFGRGASQEAA